MNQARHLKLQLAPKKECQKSHLWLAKIFAIALSVLFLIPAPTLALVNAGIIQHYASESRTLVNKLVNLTNVIPELSREDANKELLTLKVSTVELGLNVKYISEKFNSSHDKTKKDLIDITKVINENFLKQKKLLSQIDQINVNIAGINSRIKSTEDEISKLKQEAKKRKENPSWKVILSNSYEDTILILDGQIAGLRESIKEQEMTLSQEQEELRNKNQNINQLNTEIRALVATKTKLEENQKVLSQGVVLASDIVHVCGKLERQLETINERINSVDIAVTKVNDPKTRNEAIVKYIDNIKERSKELARLSENLINNGHKWTEISGINEQSLDKYDRRTAEMERERNIRTAQEIMSKINSNL